VFLVRLVVGVWAGLVVTLVQSADSLPAIESVRVGFRGVVEVGRWTPIHVTVRGQSPTPVTLRVVATEIEGRPVRHLGESFSLVTDSTDASLVYQHGPLKSPVLVELLSDGKVISSLAIHESTASNPLITTSQQNQLIFCLGAAQVGFEEAAREARNYRSGQSDETEPLTVQHYSVDQLSELPTDVRGWEAVDVCVISADCEIPKALGKVISDWSRQGGRIVLTGGETAKSVASAGLADWIPIQLDGDLTQRDLSSLKLLVPGGSTLRLLKGSLKTVRWITSQGWSPAQSLDGPIVVRSPHGQGIVTAIALDLNARPFVTGAGDEASIEWESLPELCRWLASLPALPKLQAAQQRPQSDLNPTGVSDLQSQLVNALDQFPELQRPSYWVVLTSALLFLIIVGPVDWLLVHRVLKKPHLTWVTLPIWIGVGTLIGLSVASRIGGTVQLTRQVDLLTSDATSGETQLDSWLAMTSPSHRRYSVKCDAVIGSNSTPISARLRWAGRPETGFRGLYRASEQLGSGSSLDLSHDSHRIETLPIRHGDSVILEAKTQSNQPLPVLHNLTDNGQRHLQGTLSHQLSGDLVDWVVAYEGFAYMPVRSATGLELPLNPGETIQLEKVPTRLVADYLGKVVSRAIDRPDRKARDYTISRTAYDPLSQDVYDLLKTVTFNQLSGGRSYTGLKNDTLQNEDLSRLVVTRRAVFFGRLRSSAYADSPGSDSGSAGSDALIARYTIDDQVLSPRYRECFVRWILPVKSIDTQASPP
jgi:hypothetical protein